MASDIRHITIGKARGLQQLSNSAGIFTICSLDHRRSLRKMLNPDSPAAVSFQALVDFKLHLCRVLAPYASGVLLDPIYAASQCVAANITPGQTGLMISLEAAGYDAYGSDVRGAELLAHWDAEKAKFMGASAVKVPLYYRPDLPKMAADRLKGVAKMAYTCQKIDLALFVGPHVYAVQGIERNDQDFARKKPRLVISTVQQLSALPVDALKVEFPADVTSEWDHDRFFVLCQELSEVCRVPWVLLSEGVQFEVFCRQLETACKAGASGFLAGRALWQEAAQMPPRERESFLNTIAVDRLRRLADIANTHGKPWHTKLGIYNNYIPPAFDQGSWQDEETPAMLSASQEGRVSDCRAAG